MSDTTRGSEKLNMKCNGCTGLSAAQLEHTVGGYYYSVFPRGIPWPELFSGISNITVNPVQVATQTSYFR